MSAKKTRDEIIVQTGLEAFLADGLPQLAGQRVGLITNPTGVNAHLRSTVDLLSADSRMRLCALFGPEHGIYGNVQAGIEVEGSQDQRTGLPVYSLYSGSKRPAPAALKGLDALIFDIQDVGVRYYTYPATMAQAQEAAAEAGLTFVVFDRPDPISGTHIEGNVLDTRFASLVGIHPLPIRHGLTIGEQARLFAAERGYPQPIVVAMRGWHRSMWFDETGLPWVPPSPNLPTLDSAALYPGTCLLEGTNLSEGRGTTRPFELFGAPWLNSYCFIEELERLALPGAAFRPTCFTPTFSKYAGTPCNGVQIHITERDSMRPVELGLHLLSIARNLHADAFTWIKSADGTYFIDRLLGSDQPHTALDSGAAISDIIAGWPAQVAAFIERRRPYLLYTDDASS